jgi:hypothetical protein
MFSDDLPVWRFVDSADGPSLVVDEGIRFRQPNLRPLSSPTTSMELAPLHATE